MPGYRPPSREPRGTWARAIHEKRRRDGISQTGGFEVLGPRLGLGPKSRQSYINLDMGDREPTAAEAAVLAEWLGGYPVDNPSAGVEANAPADLILALTAQTTAINRLIDRLDSLASAAIRDGVMDALREAGLGPTDGESPPAPPLSPQP